MVQVIQSGLDLNSYLSSPVSTRESESPVGTQNSDRESHVLQVKGERFLKEMVGRVERIPKLNDTTIRVKRYRG